MRTFWLLKKDVFLHSMMESGPTGFDVFLRGHALRNQFNGFYRSGSVENSHEPLGVTGKMKTPCSFNPTLGYVDRVTVKVILNRVF